MPRHAQIDVEPQAELLAQKTIATHGKKLAETELLELVSDKLQQTFDMSRHRARGFAINAIADAFAPRNCAINPIKTTRSCVWLNLNGQEAAIPVSELHNLVSGLFPVIKPTEQGMANA